MYWVQSQTKMRTDFISSFPQSPLYSHSSPYSSSPSLPYNSDYQKQQSPSSGAKINPAIIFIIVILAVLFFVSGLLHLLVRFLIKHRSSSISTESTRYPEMSESGTFQRQLQQLFHLHDSGLDQAFIDALPIFLYEEVMGLKEPFDCAVCLCEFSQQDKLRLLPLCSHAFHIDCIDTWLLSNSTCPLCRGTLYMPGLAIENPIFNFENPREEDCSSGYGASSVLSSQKPIGNEIVNENRVFSVRLGKFRSLLNDGEEERGEVETSSSKLGERRCYSMGSYQYVVADSDLQVTLRSKRGVGESMRLFKGRGGDNGNSLMDGDLEGKKINRGSKGESYSVSKIWLWSKKDKFPGCSETQMGSSSSINSGLPWVDRSQGI